MTVELAEYIHFIQIQCDYFERRLKHMDTAEVMQRDKYQKLLTQSHDLLQYLEKLGTRQDFKSAEDEK